MTRANFFLVGAAKAGTTSLASFLENIPEVFISPIKEPCHFCPDINHQLRDEMKRQQLMDTDKYFAQGMPFPMHIAHVDDPAQYDMLFSQAGGATAIGECSTYYLPSKVAAERIHAYNPDAKIIVVLREPVSRIESHYRMDQRMGLERRALADCIQEEISLGDAADFTNCRMYLAMSDYAEQVARYMNVFGADKVCVLRLEELKDSPDSSLRRVLAFLGLSAENVDLSLPRENAGDAEPRFKALDRLLYQSGLKRFLRHNLRKVLPRSALKALKAKYQGGEKSRSRAEDDASEWKDNLIVRQLVTRYSETDLSHQ